MSTDLKVALWLSLHGGAATAAKLRRFTEQSEKNFGRLRTSIKQAWQDMNGFSTASKLVAAAGGISLLKNTLDANLEFEKSILEMKQLAEMTQTQAAELRKAAIDNAADLLATPQDIAEAMRTLANAGMKYDAIAGTIKEAARAALVFRSSVTDIANMDFDIETKFHIDPSRLKAMHEMLYYHSKEGRFEAKSLSTFAPEYLNEMNRVGMGGEKALNFAGALTQVLQKIKPATQPGEVSTLIKHGLGHITDKMYVKNIKKATGIDVEKFMPNGKFYGEGGVQGMLDLAKALKAKGLDNPFKMSQAGFRDQYTRDFWLQMIKSVDEIQEQMKLADKAAGNNVIDKDVTEIKNSNFGKVKKGQIQIEKAKVSEPVTQGVSWFGQASEFFADHPGTVAAGGATAVGWYLRHRYTKNRKARLAKEAFDNAGGVGGVQNVFVTNMPGGGLAGDIPGAPGGGSTATKATKALPYVAAGLPVAVAATVAYSAYQAHEAYQRLSKLQEQQRMDDEARKAKRAEIDKKLRAFGGDSLVNATKGYDFQQLKQVLDGIAHAKQTINIHIDGKQVATVVNAHNASQAKRH